MGILRVDTLEPEGATTTLTVGESGQNTVLPGNIIKLNSLKDAGGNSIFVSDGAGALSSVNSGFGGSLAVVSSQTFSNVSDVTFTSAMLTSTYKEYVFTFYNIHPDTNDTDFTFQANQAGGGGYNETTTSSYWYIRQGETATGGTSYDTSGAQAQNVLFQFTSNDITNDADQGLSGELHLMNPAGTAYKKQWWGTFQYTQKDNPNPFASMNMIGGTWDTLLAIDDIQFKCNNASTFDGTIKLWGWK